MKQLFKAIQAFFLSERGQVVFAVLLLILIPTTMVFNTLSTVQSARQNMDIELQRKAFLAEQVFQSVVGTAVQDQTKLQEYVDNVKSSSEEVWGIDVLKPQGELFTVVASAVPSLVGKDVDDLNAVIAWHRNEAIAYQTISSDKATVNQEILPGDSTRRFWVVVSPIKNSEGKHVALISMKFSSQVVDDLVRGSVTRATVMLIATILVVILLLASNTKLFQYTILFQKLKEVDQMKDEFISIASHELRTPITGIRGYIDMTLDGSFGTIPDKAKEALTTVAKSADRLNVLVEDLLNVSRIEQGRLDLKLSDVEPFAVIQEVITELMPMAQEKNLALTCTSSGPLPVISVNRDRFKQVMVNLVGNGIKYTPKGNVSVQPEVHEGTLRIKVADTGIGMSPKELERLFTKFYRVQNDKTSEISGTGLGLWITKQIVEKMSGGIEVESIEGVGSQFIVTFDTANGRGKTAKKT
ncbi:MAG: HAMP domain-containing sensor histidine kinase [Candidatus Kerfeldbacteria bacterium]